MFLLQEAADVGQIGGRKSAAAAAAEGVDWRRRRRGEVLATTRYGCDVMCVCVCVCVLAVVSGVLEQSAARQRQGNAMQCSTWRGLCWSCCYIRPVGRRDSHDGRADDREG